MMKELYVSCQCLWQSISFQKTDNDALVKHVVGSLGNSEICGGTRSSKTIKL